MRMLRLLLGLLALGTVLAGWRPWAPGTPVSGTEGEWLVERVVDGDTILVRQGSAVLTVRLLGVDTPETRKPGSPIECFGPEASAFTEAALGGQLVRLEAGAETVDRYGRRLAWVWRAEELVNLTLVREGMARVYRPEAPLRYEALLDQAEDQARTARTGLWGAC
jgi:micrococcal nuclease